MSAPADIRSLEHDLVQQVSVVIRAMPFLWLAPITYPQIRALAEKRELGIMGYSQRSRGWAATLRLARLNRHPTSPAGGSWWSLEARTLT
jgi:hypothetical protein